MTQQTITAEQYKAMVRARWSEKQFQNKVVNLAKLLGWRVYHTYDSRRCVPGFPDLVLLRRGVLVVLELKVGRNTPTAEQDVWLAAFREMADATVRVFWPEQWEEIEQVLGRA